MSTDDNVICVNCGKGKEEDIGHLKTCVACKMVKYCSRDCQIAHRPQHKRECKRRAAELHDKELFKVHPPNEDCPICFLPLPIDEMQTSFRYCCGKRICNGCFNGTIKERVNRSISNGVNYKVEDELKRAVGMCLFCRENIEDSEEEEIKRLQKLMERGNAEAFTEVGKFYSMGWKGLPQDWTKSNELFLKAGDLGDGGGYFYLGCYYRGLYDNLGNAYENVRGVDQAVDKKKAKYFYELGAMNGHVYARHYLGIMEGQAGNHRRAYKHMVVAAKSGHKLSLDKVKEGFKAGHITKDEYEQTLRAYQKREDEMKSDMRTKAEDI
jgi:hypothetical protein